MIRLMVWMAAIALGLIALALVALGIVIHDMWRNER